MNVSVGWLRELAPGIEGTPEEIADRLGRVATAVEGIEPVGAGLEHIVVGRVLEVRPHPNADRLSLCRVDAGRDEPIDVVCGAPVIDEGGLYPYVPTGATLPGGFAIESRKIRGEVSHGMLCSEMELQLGRDRGGIMRLADGPAPGTALGDALGLPDVRLSLDLNPNRVDLACHMGVARELAPGGDASLSPRAFGGPGWSAAWRDGEREAAAGGVAVRIEDPERCPRYLAAVIRGVRVGPSPTWLAGRLLAAGAQPINNVVDATNYVLRERNQPLHAFDLRALEGTEIRVRAARPRESLTTLDGEAHELGPDVTVIADRSRAVALAGVMGGLETEVTPNTVDVLIECALFDPGSVRRTARAAGLSTDASYRFERGIDPGGQDEALRRTVELILAVAGGEADPEGIRVGRPPEERPVLDLRSSRVGQVLGVDLEPRELEDLLAPIGFHALDRDADRGAVRVRVPGWRGDVTREIDLVEEVARRYGYDELPGAPRRFRPSSVPEDPAVAREARVRRWFAGAGLLETRSLSFVPEEHRGNRAIVAVPNPLSAEESFLRSGVVPVLLRRLEHNYARGRRDVRLFEVGAVFEYASDPPEPVDRKNAGLERFVETRRVGALWTGRQASPHWEENPEDIGLWHLKGHAEALAERLLAGCVEPVARGDDPAADRLAAGWLDDRGFRLTADGRTVGVAGPVRPRAVDAPPWAAPAWALEFELEAVRERERRAFRPVSSFPAVRRDLAVTVPASVPAGDVERALREVASDLLESVELFDVYRGEGIGGGRKSLAWAFRFRADDRTLTDDDVEAEMSAVASALEKRFDARIRTS